MSTHTLKRTGMPPVTFSGELLASSPEKGARTSIYLASSSEVEKVSGKYFANSKQKSPALQATDKAVARKLWEVSAKMVGLGEAVPVGA